MLDLRKVTNTAGNGMQVMKAHAGRTIMVGKALDGRVVLYFEGSEEKACYTPQDAYRIMQAIGQKIGVELPDLVLAGG